MLDNNGDKEKLNRLEKRLYSRNAPNIINEERTEIRRDEEEAEVNQNWQDVKTGGFDELAEKFSKMANRKNTLVKKVFLVSMVFFLVALGVAAFVILGGINSVSSKNVDIKIVGPISVGGGQEISLLVNVINNNNTDLESASMLVEYPQGSRSPEDMTKDLEQQRFDLGTIKSGESYNQNIKAVFFGEKEEIKKIKFSVEYRVENSSALFYKEKDYELSISSAPIIITPTYPKEVNSGQEISFNIEVVSNTKDKLDDFLVNVGYPFGFIFKEAFPRPSFGNNIWQFRDLNSGEKKTIAIKGNIIGQDNEEKVFKIDAGTASEDDERAIAIPFSQLMESISVKKSFIGINVFIEGKESDYASRGGEQVAADFTIMNNLPSILYNASVEVAFRGAAFNGSNVAPGNNGFFQSYNNTILWDKRLVPEFSGMEPGSQKKLTFRVTPLMYSNIPSGSKPEIEMTITAKGERILESGSAEQVSASETRKIILTTDLLLNSRIVRSLGNIENSGPIPPKANMPTTYTVIWSMSNSFNQASNVEVRATLPSYVKWTGVKSPSDEAFSYNQATNEVVWNIGSVLPNTGFSGPKKEVYFQLEFLPSTSQVGSSPKLLGETAVYGIDKVTGMKIEYKVPALTTSFYGDPSYRTGDDMVAE